MKQAATEIGLDTGRWVGGGLNIVFLGPRTMRRINREFLDHDYVTDVISFDLRQDNDWNDGDCLGEVLVCPRVAVDNAAEYNTSPGEELMLYIIHGLLHVSGLDDACEAEKRAMRRAEKTVMNRLARAYDFSGLFAFEYD